MKPEELSSPIIDEARMKVAAGVELLKTIDQAAAGLRTTKAQNEARLKEIREKLPTLLAEVALDEASPSRATAMKEELRQLEESLEIDIPEALKGLESRHHRVFAQIQQVKRGTLEKIGSFLDYMTRAAAGDDRAFLFAADVAPVLGLTEANIEEVKKRIMAEADR